MFTNKTAIAVIVRCAFLIAVGISATASAQDLPPPNPRYLAATCANCHGTNGVSTTGLPRLAGLSEAYLIQQMQAFKSGQRPATVMHQLAKGYTDDQISAMAGFFAAQQP